MKLQKLLPIKRQNSLHSFINCKSILDHKMSIDINKTPILTKRNLNIPFNLKQTIENNEANRKSNYSKIILKPIIKDKTVTFKQIPNSPLIKNPQANKLKQKIRHSSKSGVTVPLYMKNKFKKEKINCINKDKKEPMNKTMALFINEFIEEQAKKKNISNDKKIDIIYKSQNCISATQKGYLLKNNTEKENNQDCSLIIENVCGIKNYNIYSIMDGHGSNGHLVSNYIKENIIKYFNDISFYFKKIKTKEKSSLIYPENILDIILKKLQKNDFQKIKDFYKTVDESLSSIEVHFDSNFSGSTCIILFQLGNNIISCNVGDSRAILIKSNKEIIELSHDQKPEEENEKKRIENMGGIVSQCNDLYDDGKEGGPFRVWMKGCDYPGIAMSRSIGDKIAHNIGVINEPEIMEFTSDELAKVIVLGSDGVFQFLNNKEICDIIFEKKEKNVDNNEYICKRIINLSRNKFIENEDYVIDDITISLVFINSKND